MFNNTKHKTASLSCAIIALAALRRMMEHSVDDAVDGSIGIDALIIHAKGDLRNNPLQNLRGDLAGGLVEDLHSVSICGGEEKARL
jgi:hypothetical protein